MNEEKLIVEEQVVEPFKKPKMKGHFFRNLFIFLIVASFVVIGFGFLFPGLLWTKSLGVTYTKQDYNSMMTKLAYVKDAVPAGGSQNQYNYLYGKTTHVEVDFTSAEITSFFNENRPDYYAIKNVQVRVNEDGTIEATGSANVDYFLNEVLGGNYSKDQIKERVPMLGMLPSKVNLYLNFSGSVTNNQSSVTINNVAVQGITIPANYIQSSEAVRVVTDGLNKIMQKYNTSAGSNFARIAVENGKVVFKGDVPSSLERVVK